MERVEIGETDDGRWTLEIDGYPTRLTFFDFSFANSAAEAIESNLVLDALAAGREQKVEQ